MTDDALRKHKKICYGNGSPIPGCPVCARIKRAEAEREAKRYSRRRIHANDAGDTERGKASHMIVLDLEADDDRRWYRHVEDVLNRLEPKIRWPSKEEILEAVAEDESLCA